MAKLEFELVDGIVTRVRNWLKDESALELFELVNGTVTRVGEWPEGESALELSIQKWEFIVDSIKAGLTVEGDGTQLTCALCADFFLLRCVGCVVSESTGLPLCEGTPYDDWRCFYPIPLGLAEDELEFLKGLR